MTSRTWRMSRPPVCSSSNTVGIVRTGTPRSRQAETTFPRRVPGADGIAIRTSCGSTSSSTRPELAGRPQHLEAAIDARALLARVVVDEADGPVAELRVAHELAQQQAPAVARADDQDRARVLAHARPAQRALVGGVDDEARAAEEDEHQQPVEDEHAGRHVDRHEAARRREQQLRLHHHDVGDEREHAGQRRLRDPQVLALRRVAHPVPVDAEQREDRDAADDREAERAHEQVVVELGHAAGPVEAQAVGEEVGQRDQPGVQRDLRSGVAMDGKGRGAEPAAHQAHSIRGHGVRGLDDLGDLLAVEHRAHRDREMGARELVRRGQVDAEPRTGAWRAAGASARGSRPCGRRPPLAARRRGRRPAGWRTT